MRKQRHILAGLGGGESAKWPRELLRLSERESAEAVDVATTSVGTLLARAERRFSDVLLAAGEAA